MAVCVTGLNASGPLIGTTGFDATTNRLPSVARPPPNIDNLHLGVGDCPNTLNALKENRDDEAGGAGAEGKGPDIAVDDAVVALPFTHELLQFLIAGAYASEGEVFAREGNAARDKHLNTETGFHVEVQK